MYVALTQQLKSICKDWKYLCNLIDCPITTANFVSLFCGSFGKISLLPPATYFLYKGIGQIYFIKYLYRNIAKLVWVLLINILFKFSDLFVFSFPSALLLCTRSVFFFIKINSIYYQYFVFLWTTFLWEGNYTNFQTNCLQRKKAQKETRRKLVFYCILNLIFKCSVFFEIFHRNLFQNCVSI